MVILTHTQQSCGQKNKAVIIWSPIRPSQAPKVILDMTKLLGTLLLWIVSETEQMHFQCIYPFQ